MHSSTLRLTTALGAFLCVATVAPPAAVAQQNYMAVTIHQPVRVPGGVLAPGNYEFETFTYNPYVRIHGPNGVKMYVQATPSTPTDRGTVLALRSVGAGAIAELATWYPRGGTFGYEFAPHVVSANDLSAAHLTGLDKRLSAAEDAVNEAERQLGIAESNRSAIRTERRHAR